MKKLLMAVAIGLVLSSNAVYAKSEALYGAKEIVVKEHTDTKMTTTIYALKNNSCKMAIRVGNKESVQKDWDGFLELLASAVPKGQIEIIKHDNTFGVETIYTKQQIGKNIVYSMVKRSPRKITVLDISGGSKNIKAFANYLEANGVSSLDVNLLQGQSALNDLENLDFDF